MRIRSTLAVVLLCAACTGSPPDAEPAGQLVWDAARLESSRRTLGPEDRARLLRKAEYVLMDDDEYSVTFNAATPPATGDPRDYCTLHAHWWPNPDAPDGLPYVDRGIVNPDNRADVDQWSSLTLDVLRLATAYHLSGEERFAERAAHLLRRFFLDPVTGMHPNMDHSKRIPGVDETGAFEVATLSNRVRWLWDSAVLLRGSAAWTDADEAGLQAWSRAFLDWMETDRAAHREFVAQNNHGTAFHLIAAILSKYVGDLDKARDYGRRYATELLPVQFDADGLQPFELPRGDNLFYHVYNLKTALDLQATVDDLGVDFLASLEGPLDRLLPYLDGREEWTAWPGAPRPHKIKWEYDLLIQGAVQFGRPELYDLARSLRPPILHEEYVWPRPEPSHTP